jgi:glycosyltransferase involved in cell wall biosynthesis
MNVLWITNIALPEALELLNGKGVLRSSGGWLIGAAEMLCKQPDLSLTIATVSNRVEQLTRLKGEKITYYLLPYGKGNEKINHDYEPLWRKVNEEVKPEVVHLHGTEFSHGLAYLEACGAENVCVSIQGLTSAYYSYYYYGLTRCEIRKAITPLSIIRGGILHGYKGFKRRGELEKEILMRVSHIIGRTSWDRERTWAINPNAQYHYGGETLRSDFYSGETWKYENCTPHTIFLSQSFYPIKGLHMVLRAMPLVLQHYPDAKLRVAGPDISRSHGWKELIKLSDYGMIIRKMIKKNHLEDCISFTGALDGEGMRKEYLKSNVFVCPSSIENSPNSLGEAQLLGVPVIASYVGGIPDMMKGDEDHMYRFEEIEMLAFKICELFTKAGDINTKLMREEALRRHNPYTNANDLVEIYKKVING